MENRGILVLILVSILFTINGYMVGTVIKCTNEKELTGESDG